MSGKHPQALWSASPSQAPLLMTVVVLAALLAWMTSFGQRGPLDLLLIVDVTANPLPADFQERWQLLLTTLQSGQLWRLFTPDFLHFSLAHLAFNLAMLWFLASQVEIMLGRGWFLLVFVGSSLGSNVLQYLLEGPFFGGLSGAVYGFLGYCWLAQQRSLRFHLPPMLMPFALVWLLIGLTPLPEWLSMGRMANGAHFGGLMAGLVLALLPMPKKAPSNDEAKEP